MKILINFDFMNAVKNVNEGITPFKVIRNNKSVWAKFNLPIYTAINLLATKGDIKSSLLILGLQFGFLTVANMIVLTVSNPDIYSVKSDIALGELVSKFKDNNIDTSKDLLKKSEVYNKKYEIKLNESKIPELIQSKYILVPTYDYLGNVKDTSVLQEHVVGSNEYVLSLVSPKKVLKPALSSI